MVRRGGKSHRLRRSVGLGGPAGVARLPVDLSLCGFIEHQIHQDDPSPKYEGSARLSFSKKCQRQLVAPLEKVYRSERSSE